MANLVKSTLPLASGTGRFWKRAAKSIRIIRHGCTNRPFYHIVVTHRRRPNHLDVIEQLGTFDPMPNEFNEKLVSLNMERIKYWIGKGAHISVPTAELFGIAGFLPIHPRSYMEAWRNRRQAEEAEQARTEQDQERQSETASA